MNKNCLKQGFYDLSGILQFFLAENFLVKLPNLLWKLGQNGKFSKYNFMKFFIK
jgi:hypothetical protein